MRVIRRIASVRHRLRRDPNRFFKRVAGVIHVGASAGQERDFYDSLGLQVLWIEPIPERFEELQRNLIRYPRQRAVRALITDQDNQAYAFHIASNWGQSSSILELKLHKEIWPTVSYERTISVVSSTLPAVLRSEGISPGDYASLVIDVQGAELLVLRGASTILSSFSFIKLEVADFEAYEGCCQLEEVSAFLAGHGFKELVRERQVKAAGIGSYYDVSYVRKRR